MTAKHMSIDEYDQLLLQSGNASILLLNNSAMPINGKILSLVQDQPQLYGPWHLRSIITIPHKMIGT
ncbi:MAG: hypothetical protein KC643_14355 [Nitrospira sp.]|nr:hypothetical protein [Nitrospira sp.]